MALALLFGATQGNAAQTIRELFDNLGAYGPLDGKGSDATTVGLQSTWSNSPAGSTAIVFKDSWTVDWVLGGLEYNGVLLPSTAGGQGCLNSVAGNLNTINDPNTGLPYGIYTSQSYATRPLTTNAYINFKADGTYYFSVRMVKSYPWAAGDSSAGLGFASGSGTNAHFVGAGFTRPTPFLAEDGVTDIGDTVYISTGTLGQDGVPSHPEDSGGPYYPRVSAAAGLVAGDVRAGLLVGRLTTTAGGASTLEAKVYLPGSALDTDPGSIVWDATWNFTETNVMTELLVWMHGTIMEYDAIRVGTAYGDVIGLELVGAPKGSPGNTVFAGTPVTISQIAYLNSGAFPMSFQWRSNSVDLLDATNATLALTDTITNFTADYSVVVSNFYGMLTSAVTHLSVLPAIPPYFVVQPGSETRYLGGAAALTAVVDGTPPFGFQWKHAGTNIGPATLTSATTNLLTFSPITSADAGNYQLTVTNQFGSTNSYTVTLTVLAPAPGYESAISALAPWGYWRLNETDTNNPAIRDDWGGHHGQSVDPGNMTFADTGAPDVGFPAGHKAIHLMRNGPPSRLNLPVMPGYSNAMTFTCWVNFESGDYAGILLERQDYGDAFGVETVDSSQQLGLHWGSTTWNSGLNVPLNTWTFVAMVVEPAQVTMYMGSTKVSIESASSAMTIDDASYVPAKPLTVGRNPWPWADDAPGASWATAYAKFSDAAIFYKALTSQEVTNLYLAGVGAAIESTPDGVGNLTLNWFPGFTLQQSTNLLGGWTDVAATPPISVPILTTGQKFYRVRP